MELVNKETQPIEIKEVISLSDAKQHELIKPNIQLWANTNKNNRYSTKVFSKEEIELIFNTVKSNTKDYPKNDYGKFLRLRDWTIMNVTYYLALRIGECVSLRFADVDFKKRRVYIDGKNNKTKLDRVLYLPQNLIPVFEEYLSCSKRYWGDCPYIFPNFSKTSHISSSCFKGVVREKILKVAKLWETPVNGKISRTRAYSLRKSRLSHLLNETKDLFLVSNLAGHKSVNTTQQYYVEADDNYHKYMESALDGNLKAYSKPSIEINQTNNYNVTIEKLTLQLQQQQTLIIQLQQQIIELIKSKSTTKAAK